MPLTFNPTRPDEGMNVEFDPKPIKHNYQDGYVGRAGRGAKADQRPHEPRWTNAKKAEAEYIIEFLEDHDGYEPFWWTPNHDVDVKLFVCERFSYKWKNGEFCDINATFEETAG